MTNAQKRKRKEVRAINELKRLANHKAKGYKPYTPFKEEDLI